MNWFNVGKIVNTHGIRGELRVVSNTDFPEDRFAKGEVLSIFDEKDNKVVDLTVQSGRQHKQFYLVIFEGHENINLVEKYKGMTLKVSEDQLFELEENEFYYHEIIGCEVVTEDGEIIGLVSEIYSPGANDVWGIKRNGKKDAMIPYIEDVVKNVDIENKKITIHVMEGLLD